MRKWPVEVIEKAKKLRLKGATYSQVKKELRVPKSTLSLWFKALPRPSHMYFIDRDSWLKEIRKLSVASKNKKRQDETALLTKKIKEEVGRWKFLDSLDMGKCLLSILYWTEGQKLPEKQAPVKFANTDPRLVLLFLTLLRKCYPIDETKLRIGLHVHWYHNKNKVKRFWGKLLNIDESNFNKIYIKHRGKTRRFRKNFAGICFVIYYSLKLRREIVETGYNIAERIIGKIPVFLD